MSKKKIKIPSAQMPFLAQLEGRMLELNAELRDLQNVRHGTIMAVLRAEGINGFPQYVADIKSGTVLLETADDAEPQQAPNATELADGLEISKQNGKKNG